MTVESKRSVTIEWSDPRPLAQAGLKMTGIEFLRAIRDKKFAAPPIAVLLGFDLVEVEPGHAVFEIMPGERHWPQCPNQRGHRCKDRDLHKDLPADWRWTI